MITKEMLKEFREEFKEAVAALEEKHALKIDIGTITFNSDEFSGKITAKSVVDKDGNEVDPAKVEFEKYAADFGLSPDDYLKEVYVEGDHKPYILVGIKPRARKNNTVIRQKSTGKEYVCAASYLKDANGEYLCAFKNVKVTKVAPPGMHICKYCGGNAKGTFEDLLCDNCRELFGHALYSEL